MQSVRAQDTSELGHGRRIFFSTCLGARVRKKPPYVASPAKEEQLGSPTVSCINLSRWSGQI